MISANDDSACDFLEMWNKSELIPFTADYICWITDLVINSNEMIFFNFTKSDVNPGYQHLALPN